MPIYEYRCGACGHTLDALQKVSDPHLTDCPECDAAALRRLVSAPAFRLKGGGWYETDFKSDKEKKRNLVDGKGDGKGDGKSDGESKSDGGASKDGATAKEAKASADAARPSSDGGKSVKAAKPAGGSGSEAA